MINISYLTLITVNISSKSNTIDINKRIWDYKIYGRRAGKAII